MSHPTEAYAIAPAISPAQEAFSTPASSFTHSSAARTFPRLFGNPQICLPGLWDPPARLPRVSLATPDRHIPRKGWHPQLKGELSPLCRIFRRHQHLPFGCQPRSPECSTKRPNASLRPRLTLPDSAGLPPGLYATNIRSYKEPHSLGQDICAALAHPRTIFLYVISVHHNASELITYMAKKYEKNTYYCSRTIQLSNAMLNILQKLSLGILCSQLADQITFSVNISIITHERPLCKYIFNFLNHKSSLKNIML